MSQKVEAAYTLASSNPTPAEFTASAALEQAIAAAAAVKPNKKELFTLDKRSIRGLDFDILKLIEFRDTTLQQLQTGDVVPYYATGWALEDGIKPVSKIIRTKDRQRVQEQRRRQRKAERRAAEQSTPSGDRIDKGKKRDREGGKPTRRKKTRRRKSRKVLQRRLGRRKTRAATRYPVLK